MKANELPVFTGGLFRCCYQHLENNQCEVKIGDTTTCQYCSNEMIVAMPRDRSKPHWFWKDAFGLGRKGYSL